MNNVWKYLAISLLIALPLLLLLRRDRPTPMTPATAANAPALLMYCAAGIKNPVEAVARRYEAAYGIRIELQYGGSGTLLSNLTVAARGDLYLAADSSYTDIARAEGLVREVLPVAYLRPVIAVTRDNPKQIAGSTDLLREDVQVALANPDAASIGKQTRLLFQEKELWTQLKNAVTTRGVFKPTVNDVANDVKLGTVDAAVVWDATVNQYPELLAIPIADTEHIVKHVTVGILAASDQPTRALHFARYLTAPDQGLPVFDELGFPPIAGDKWADSPEISYFAGAVNRHGIEETLQAFEAREGIRLNTVYNGCGILLGQIRLGATPDAYHTGDVTFMVGVEDRFTPPVEMTETDLVIIAPKGNPGQLRSLSDLAREGLQVGLAHEEQSALGALTARLLKQHDLYDAVSTNLAATAPTADLLVNQLRTGSLDAAIVYAANTAAAPANLAVIPIDLPGAKAIQTFSVARDTDYPQLMHRLYEALRREESRQRLTRSGFRWLGGGTMP